jgi:hypothetical protein
MRTRAWKRTTTLLGLAFVLSAALLTVPAAAPAVVADASAGSEMVVTWNANAQTAIIATAGQGPTVALLHLAMVQGAVYDAVNAIEGGYQPYLGAPAVADPGDSSPAAVATAAHDVLVSLFPSQAATLNQQYADSLLGILDGPAKAGGIEVGAAAAAAMLAARANDGRFTPFTVVQGDEPGEWRSTSVVNGVPVVEPAPWVGNVRPFIVSSAASLLTSGPNKITSVRYARDFREVEAYGSLTSSIRTADQTDAALFWQANGAGLWNSILRQLAVTQNLDIAEAARMFAMVDLAGADGVIGCWYDKYVRYYWRPITAIREADTDGNPATKADPTWTPLFTTPAFPEHPSGHSCVSGAIAATLQGFFGTDAVSFSTFSSFSGTTRSFTSFSQAITEIMNARVWAGIHFRTACVQGQAMGAKIAHILEQKYFQPVS